MAAGSADGLSTHVLKRRGNVRDDFALSSGVIGRGSYGQVFVGVNRLTSGRRAVKSVPQSESRVRADRTDTHEVRVMEPLDHPNVVKLIMTYQDATHLHLVMELCSGGSLAGHLRKVGHFEVPDVLVMSQQVFRAVAYLHGSAVCHRDLKLENFLVAHPIPLPWNTLKVADFGLSCCSPAGAKMTDRVGTPMYWSPQVVAGRYDRSCDVWSCGVIVYALISGVMPFVGKSEDELMGKVKRGNYTFTAGAWAGVSDAAKMLVRGLLRFEDSERFTPQGILKALRGNPQDPPIVGAALASGHKDGGMRVISMLATGVQALAGIGSQRRAALRAVAWQSEDQDSPDMSNYYQALDLDGDGLLSAGELISAGRWTSKQIAQMRLYEVCPLDYTDFLVVVQGETLCLRRGVYKTAFEALDRDGDGVISAGDLSGVPRGHDGAKETRPRDYEAFEAEMMTLHL